jgi:hypothetical protein
LFPLKIQLSTALIGRLVATLSALAVASCGPACDISDDAKPPDIYSGGAAKDGQYASSSSLGPLLAFPGGKQYQLVHHLGFTPNDVHIDFAFGINDDRFAPCAGNSCEIRCIDDQIIWIKNDTCSDFWILVTASGASPFPVARCTNDNIDSGPAVMVEDSMKVDGGPFSEASNVDP